MAKRPTKKKTTALEKAPPAALADTGGEALGVSVDALPEMPGFVGIINKRTSGERLAEITEAVGHALPNGCVYLACGEGEVFDLTGAPTLLVRELRYWGRHDYDARGDLVEAVETKAEADAENAQRDRQERLRESWLVLAAHVVGDGEVRLSLSRQQDGSSRWCERLARGIVSAGKPEFAVKAARLRGEKVSEALMSLPPRYRVMGELEGDASRGYNLINTSIKPLDVRTLEAMSAFGNSERGKDLMARAIATFDKRADAVREAF